MEKDPHSPRSTNDHQGPNPPSYDEGEPELNLQHYWHVILERRWLVVATFVTIISLALIYLFKAPEIYQAESRLQIDREYENVLNTSDGFAVNSREEDYLQTQYKNLQSRSLINTVIQELQLQDDERYADRLNVTEAVKEDITVAPIRSSRLVDIKVDHTDPDKAQEIANTLVSTFVSNNLERRQEDSMANLNYLSEQLKEQEKKLRKAKRAVQEYKTENDQPALEKTENTLSEARSTIQIELSKAEATAAEKSTLVQEVGRMLSEDVPIQTIPRVSTDERIIALQSKVAEKEAELQNLSQKYLENHPAVSQLEREIDSLRSSIQQQARQIYQTLKWEAQAAEATVASLEDLVKKYESDQLELSELRIEFDVLESRAERHATLYNKLLESIKETEIAAESKSNNMRVVDEAIEPYKPVKPRVSLILLMGLVGGLAGGIGLALFVNYLDDSIKSQDDVETYLRLPFLGYVPHIKTNSVVERALQAHLHPQSAVAESFRSMRAVVSLMPNADRYKVLTVTSTTPAEGKSVIASNLAVVFAQTGLKTLLIDADLRRPSMHRAFRLHSPKGIGTYLQDETVKSEEIVHSSEVANLDVICCGPPPSSPSELISSKRMREFIQHQRQHYDRVVLDCAPVTAVSDPLVLASRADGVVFVTKFNRIRRDHARKTIQRIQDAGIQILGVTLNDIDFEGKDSYYYYYYYQNRYYSDYYQPAERPEKETEEPPVKPT